jgi:hypothetical protein
MTPTIEDVVKAIAENDDTPAHTSGPWQSFNFVHDPFTIVGNIDGPDDGAYHFTEICTVNDGSPGALANAQLIAAAPELLAMLKHLRERDGECLADHPSWLTKIDGLLARAEGRACAKAEVDKEASGVLAELRRNGCAWEA